MTRRWLHRRASVQWNNNLSFANIVVISELDDENHKIQTLHFLINRDVKQTPACTVPYLTYTSLFTVFSILNSTRSEAFSWDNIQRRSTRDTNVFRGLRLHKLKNLSDGARKCVWNLANIVLPIKCSCRFGALAPRSEFRFSARFPKINTSWPLVDAKRAAAASCTFCHSLHTSAYMRLGIFSLSLARRDTLCLDSATVLRFQCQECRNTNSAISHLASTAALYTHPISPVNVACIVLSR